jgi:hypothetical protein
MKIQNKKIPAAENWTALQAAFKQHLYIYYLPCDHGYGGFI